MVEKRGRRFPRRPVPRKPVRRKPVRRRQEMLDADDHEQERVGRYDHQKYMANRDAILEKRKKHYQEIKDTVRARYLEKNKEKIRAYKHEYYLAHKEKWRKQA